MQPSLQARILGPITQANDNSQVAFHSEIGRKVILKPVLRKNLRRR
jgi:hypothetical protein